MSEHTGRIAVLGVGQSDRATSRRDVDYAEIVHEAVQRALTDAGVGLLEVDHAVTAALDFVDGRTIANMSTAEVVGSFLKPEGRLCGDGTNAVVYALAKMRAGGLGVGLVVAHAKESQGDHHAIEAAAFDPFTERRLDPDGDVVAGLAAQRWYLRTGRGPQEAAEAVAAARDRGRGTHTSIGDPVTPEQVLASPPLATPLRQLDKAVRSDGACALVIATEEVAAERGGQPVWIAGAATRTDAYWLARDLADTRALDGAWDEVLAQAGWQDAQVDVAELSAQYGYQDLQFSEPAQRRGVREVTPSGGWLAGGCQVVSGLDRVVAGVHQLRGTAGAQQVDGPRRVIAHGFHGLGAQTHGVVALEGGVA